MKLKCWVKEYKFEFKRPAKTSRNTLVFKSSYFIFLQDENSKVGIGECSPIYGLSIENEVDTKAKLKECLNSMNNGIPVSNLNLIGFPSIQFAIETAIKDIENGGNQILFKTPFTKSVRGIKINGLIWMGDLEFQKMQIDEKISAGFNCIKIKIGAHSFEQDLSVLNYIRNNYGNKIELRLDANGAFSPSEVMDKLIELSKFRIHSIEQPIKQGQWEKMAYLAKNSPIDVVLDEELIGINENEIDTLLDTIEPKYIILKPSLLGGFNTCDRWVEEAQKRNIKWWVTSFLESNIGLNAIAQWASRYKTTLHQGLGTGNIYTTNVTSPLHLRGENLYYNSKLNWNKAFIEIDGTTII